MTAGAYQTTNKAAANSASTGFVAKLSNLRAGTTYYYNVVVTNAGGTATGNTLSFTMN